MGFYTEICGALDTEMTKHMERWILAILYRTEDKSLKMLGCAIFAHIITCQTITKIYYWFSGIVDEHTAVNVGKKYWKYFLLLKKCNFSVDRKIEQIQQKQHEDFSNEACSLKKMKGTGTAVPTLNGAAEVSSMEHVWGLDWEFQVSLEKYKF